MTDSLEDLVIDVQRWTRYGKDRAYAKVGDTQLGYRDLHTGEVVCEAQHRATVERATDQLWHHLRAARYQPKHAGDVVPSPPADVVTAALTVDAGDPTPGGSPDRDLAVNRPGAAVHARAKALRDAAPVRTRVARLLGQKTDERNWRIGGDAEEAVAKRLARLGPEWRILHAIPVGDRGSDIDHLVVGPGGVFTVNTKNHPDADVWVRGDTVKVNGSSQHYVRNSRHEAARAATLLTARALFEVDVRGVIAVMGMTQGFTVVDQPRDGRVTVVQRKRVADHLAARPIVLSQPCVERIYEVARHLATWQPKTVAWSDLP